MRQRLTPRDRRPDPQFIPVEFTPPPSAPEPFELLFPEGLSLRIPSGFDPRDLHALLSTLRSTC